MKDEKKRTLYLKVRVSPEEMAAIKKKFENSGMSSLSTLIIPHSGKHQSAGRKTSIRGEENANSRKERSDSPEERISYIA